MPDMAQVQHHRVIGLAWEKYKSTDSYANIKRWALEPEHVECSLWAAFVEGWIRHSRNGYEPEAETCP